MQYKRWTLPYQGNWQEGLRSVFQENMLFDIDQFDNSLFNRIDLQWIRHSYVMHLIQAWDHKLYNPSKKNINSIISLQNQNCYMEVMMLLVFGQHGQPWD